MLIKYTQQCMLVGKKYLCNKYFIVLLILFLGSYKWFQHHSNRSKVIKTSNLVVQAKPVLVKNIPVNLKAMGKVAPLNSVIVRPQVDGIIKKIFFTEGSMIKQGQLLFSIDADLLQAQVTQANSNVNKANAELKNAKLKLQKSTRLYENRIISLQEHEQNIANFEIAKSNLNGSEAALKLHKLKLGFTKIYAPISGIAGKILIKSGGLASTIDPNGLVEINQLDPIQVEFDLPEEFLIELTKNINNLSKLQVQLEGLNKTGNIVYLDNQINHLNGTILLKAQFNNKDLLLWPGQLVNINVHLTEIPAAMVVDNTAIQLGQQGNYVYVAEMINQRKTNKIAKVKRVAVIKGIMTENETVILSGLKPNELVVTEGYSNLINQTMVEVYVPE